MTSPHLRTRSRKRLKVTLPGGRPETKYLIKKVPIPKCPICNKNLAGIGRLVRAKSLKHNRSKRRVWRPYGGQFCHKCLKIALKQTARSA